MRCFLSRVLLVAAFLGLSSGQTTTCPGAADGTIINNSAGVPYRIYCAGDFSQDLTVVNAIRSFDACLLACDRTARCLAAVWDKSETCYLKPANGVLSSGNAYVGVRVNGAVGATFSTTFTPTFTRTETTSNIATTTAVTTRLVTFTTTSVQTSLVVSTAPGTTVISTQTNTATTTVLSSFPVTTTIVSVQTTTLTTRTVETSLIVSMAPGTTVTNTQTNTATSVIVSSIPLCRDYHSAIDSRINSNRDGHSDGARTARANYDRYPDPIHGGRLDSAWKYDCVHCVQHHSLYGNQHDHDDGYQFCGLDICYHFCHELCRDCHATGRVYGESNRNYNSDSYRTHTNGVGTHHHKNHNCNRHRDGLWSSPKCSCGDDNSVSAGPRRPQPPPSPAAVSHRDPYPIRSHQRVHRQQEVRPC
ncbi:uncharacterized protein RCC_01405 [Ramularia collo-cygni]|uniref:Apple domain-containing protein n=1 Tax=Ramularia collo-cygni TaxID=112498 RepID=A0A2D3UMP3_9PEZI|nr:uncharacterized protein RCC_01405 [Ramularia collo-cygni]CZT15551.1 uncharacterized protein RCC_01405 [Ramularia collo-cygni]